MHIVCSARIPVRLGAGLDEQGYLTPQAMQAGLQALGQLSGMLSRYPLDCVRVVGTQALRATPASSWRARRRRCHIRSKLFPAKKKAG
jgi:exopolyphosphatase/guanosine-5'-triphosphate,3'-diphosphate pyrophosphatase